MGIVRKLSVLIGLCILPGILFAAQPKLIGLQIKQDYTESAKIEVEFTNNVKYKYFKLDNPKRLVIDFYDTKPPGNFDRNPEHNSLIKKIRTGHPDAGVTRMVVELKKDVVTTVEKHQAKRHFSPQIVFNIHSEKKPIARNHPTQPPKTIIKKTKPARDVVVLIDAGHGGKDPGAIGPSGTKEKNVVLAIAKELKRLIDKEPGMHPVMTRANNRYVSLRDRLREAREYKADVFIAIHADAFKNAKSHGASVYALSRKGASSEAARWLAEKENYSELGGVNLADKDDMLRQVLIDLSQTATIGSSIHLGNEVLQQMGRVASLHQGIVEQAPFVVLKSPDIPSILVETGFLSNPHEEKLLRSSSYQKKLAKAMLNGVREYFYRAPPVGTWIAEHSSEHQTYMIAKGDSLSMIAQRFNISLNDLRTYNNLQNNKIKIGQKLQIPSRTA